MCLWVIKNYAKLGGNFSNGISNGIFKRNFFLVADLFLLVMFYYVGWLQPFCGNGSGNGGLWWVWSAWSECDMQGCLHCQSLRPPQTFPLLPCYYRQELRWTAACCWFVTTYRLYSGYVIATSSQRYFISFQVYESFWPFCNKLWHQGWEFRHPTLYFQKFLRKALHRYALKFLREICIKNC